MGKFYYLVIFLLQPLLLSAQQIPVYNHYYNNPYLYNPAEAGSSGYFNFSFNHRQQWTGIEGAPVVSTLTFEVPSEQAHSFGVNIRNYERGLITTNHLMASYAYRMHLTETAILQFGLSAGVTSTDINLDKIDDPSDPILADFNKNSIQPIGNFGMNLRSKSGFNLGFSIPKLLETSYLNSNEFQSESFSPFNEILFMGYFKKPLDKKIVSRKKGRGKRQVLIEDAYAPLQVYVMYRHSQLVDERIEVLSTLHLHENFWLGAAYRLNYGVSGLIGFNVANFSFGYAYEPASQLVDGLTSGTHELQLTLKMGGRKKIEPRVKAPSKTPRPAKEPVDKVSEIKEVEKAPEPEAPVKKKTYYVIVKTFGDYDNADIFVKTLQEENNLHADIFYNKANEQYHVYTNQTSDLKEANAEKKKVEEQTKHKVIIITVEEN